ncbi:Uncharacterized protein Fot_38868 [Forsythia ovata]|uniref:Uncharacterized protein n=1 Tax=Forsythia ovata TaxID=205694 RepID=A0ABD1S302_9LAMI
MGTSRSSLKSRRKTKKRQNLSGSKKNRGLNSDIAKPVKKKVNIPVPEGQTTVTVDCHLNLEKTMDNVSSHMININAKLVEKEDAHHKSSNNKFENAIKIIHNSTNFSTNGSAEKMHKKVRN